MEAQGATVAITPVAMEGLSAIRPVGVASDERVFGLSESQIARRVKVIAKAAGLTDWEYFNGHSGRVGMARRMAQNGAPTHEIERQGRWKQGGGMVGHYTRRESSGSALRYPYTECKGRRENVPRGRLDRRVWAVDVQRNSPH